MNVLHETETIRLTSSEIAELWTTYLNDSMAKCVLSYFKRKVKDSNIGSVIEYALNLSEAHLRTISDIFKEAGIPLPYGFSENDVNVDAEKLFGDGFMLLYIKHLSKFGLSNYTMALGVSAREDVRLFFTDCIKTSTELCNKAGDVLLAKGLFIRPPYVDVPKESEYVQKQSYLKGLVGDKRPLNILEITNIYTNMQNNFIGKAFTMGLSQTIENKKTREYILRGKEIAEKHTVVFGDMLAESDLPVPMSYDAEVTSATEQVFSDKLILFHITGLNAFSVSLYAQGSSKSMRADIPTAYIRLSSEIAQFAKDGVDIMIDNEWLEKVPEAISRKSLAHA